MLEKIFHQMSSRCSSTTKWFGTDTEERYRDNLKTQRKLLEEYGWIDSDFTYSFNSHGFRTDEFDVAISNPSVVFLGASITMGTGVPIECTWADKISKELKLHHCNLGISGGSNDSAFRVANHYIPAIKPKLVIFVSGYPNRLDLITDQKVFTFVPSMDNALPEHAEFYKDWIIHEENGKLNYLKNRYAVLHLCSNLDIPVIELEDHVLFKLGISSRGRDLLHPGIEGNAKIADYVLEKLGDAG